MIDLADIERVSEVAKRLLVERRKYNRIQERWTQDVSHRQAQKLNTELNWQAMHILKIEAELHTACVDAELADLRDPDHYATRTLRPSGWHEYSYSPPKPRSLAP